MNPETQALKMCVYPVEFIEASRNRLPDDVRRDRVLDAIETIMALDDSAPSHGGDTSK